MTDGVSLEKHKKYVNVRQFAKKAKKRWGMKSKEAIKRWNALLQDPSVPKTKDSEGWLCMPAMDYMEQPVRINSCH